MARYLIKAEFTWTGPNIDGETVTIKKSADFGISAVNAKTAVSKARREWKNWPDSARTNLTSITAHPNKNGIGYNPQDDTFRLEMGANQ